MDSEERPSSDPTVEADAAAVGGSTSSGRRRLRRGAARTPWAQKSRKERGVVLIWFALMLVVLLGFAGFAVDVANWWYQAERLQRAADAGAHAGVVYLPGDLPGATTTARAEAAKNGYRTTGASANSTIAVTQEPNPNRLRVRITTTVPNYFVGLLGVDDIELTREAVAEYIAPVPMGSPENKLGNDPARNQNSPQFWINIAGPNSTKVSGDRFQAKVCPTSVAGCSGTANPGVNNDEYSFEGYFFALKVTSVPAGQPLKIQVYDPAMVYVGDKCENNQLTQAQADALQALPGNPYPDASTRYAPGLTPWCTGDQDIGGRTNKTTFIVRAPDDTPWSDTDNPVVSACTPTTMPSFNYTATQIYEALDPNDGKRVGESVIDGVAPWTFAEVYHRNVTVCEIPAGSVQTGDYLLQIRSNVAAASPTTYSSSIADGGHNRMSVQVGFGTAGVEAVNGSNVSINARGRLPIYANAQAADTNFFLARVLPYDAGRTLRITLYDIGDVSEAGTLQILPPTDSNVATFTGCQFAIDDSTTLTKDASTCSLKNVKDLNGRSITVDVPLPTNYTCPAATLTACWIKVRAAFPAGVSDTTTWSAAILGNPIRLVE